MKTVTREITINKDIFEKGDLVTLKKNWADVKTTKDDEGTSAFWCGEAGCKEGMIYEVDFVSANDNIILDGLDYYLNPNCFHLVTLSH